MLLNDGHVQRELALTPSQSQTIQRLAMEYLESAGRVEALPGSSSDAAVLADRRKDMLVQAGNAALDSLTSTQRRRLNEVMFQLKSIDIYRSPEFVAELNLSTEQVAQMSAVFAATAQEMKRLRAALTKKAIQRPDYENRVHEGLLAADRQADAVLNVEQRQVVDQWRGTRISFGRMHLRMVLRGKPQTAISR